MDEISSLKGIGEKSAALFHRAGVFSVHDLVYYFPSSYVRYPEIKTVDRLVPDERAALFLKVLTEPALTHVRGMSICPILKRA